MPGPDSTLTPLLCAAFASDSPSPVLASPGFNHLRASLNQPPDILCILSFLCALQDSRPLQPPPVCIQPIPTTLFSLTSSLLVPSALLSPSATQCQHPPHHIWDVLSSPHRTHQMPAAGVFPVSPYKRNCSVPLPSYAAQGDIFPLKLPEILSVLT